MLAQMSADHARIRVVNPDMNPIGTDGGGQLRVIIDNERYTGVTAHCCDIP